MTTQQQSAQESEPRAAEGGAATARVRPSRRLPGRWPVTAVFFLNGLTLCSYIVRIPDLKAAQHLDNGQLGLIGMLFGATALVTMQFVGAMVGRVGTLRVMRLALLVMPLVLLAAGLRVGLLTFVLAIAALGAVHGTLDVAMNAHAVAVERLNDRPIMSGCHAAWSVSAVIASLVGAAAVGLGLSQATHFAAVAVAVVIGGLIVGPRLVDTEGGATGPRTRVGWRTGWTRTVVTLGLTGFALMLGEGAALAWGPIFLHDNRGASLAVASIAITAYTGSQTLGRFRGDRLVMRYGAGRVFRVGALLGVAGFAVAVLSPHPVLALVGFAIFGLGGSALMPLTFSAAGHVGGDGQEAAIFVSRFTTFTYSGILLGPAIIGSTAQLVGLAWTLAGVLPVLGLIALCARLPGQR